MLEYGATFDENSRSSTEILSNTTTNSHQARFKAQKFNYLNYLWSTEFHQSFKSPILDAFPLNKESFVVSSFHRWAEVSRLLKELMPTSTPHPQLIP